MSLLKESQHLQIPLKEIESGTQNFQICIGKGGFGMVYKGQLFISGKPTTVAIKRLNEQFGQGLKEFLTEIQLLTGQTHPHLISLVGYCDEGKEKIIVYEYAEHGSLDQYLRRSSSSNNTCTLTWLEKLNICVGAACGLDYLHNHVGQHQTVIHRDIKSSNILIDENWVAKISDLGLSKLSLSGFNRSTVISNACGTPGYCEPEYIITGTVKKESDVYSFGMVLFEVLCGRLCNIRDDDGFLLSGPLAKDYYEKNKLDEIVDPSLKDQMCPESMNRFSKIAYECLHDDRGQRPPMDLVLKELEKSLEIQLSYVSEASYASEDPYKSSEELGAHASKKSTIASLELPSLKEENQLHISTEINPSEVAYRSSVDLQSSVDITMQTQPNDEITMGVVETRALSFGSLQEVTEHLLDLNQEVVKVVLDSKKHIWKHEQLFELVEEYFEDSQQTFDFCDALEKCLKRVRDIQMLIFVGLRHFEERSYVKTLENLKNLKAIGDPFTEDFFKIFQFMYRFVYRQQKVLILKLQRNKLKLDKKIKCLKTWRKVCNAMFLVIFVAAVISGVVAAAMVAPVAVIATPAAATILLALTGIWMNSFLKNYRKGMKGEKEVISTMQMGGFVGIKDLDMIKVHVDKVEIIIKDLVNNADFALRVTRGDEEAVVKLVIQEMKKKLDLLEYNVESLETQAGNYVRQIRRTRNVVLQRIVNSPIKKNYYPFISNSST